MDLTQPEAFILFSLGKFHEEANKALEGKPLRVSMTKAAFIELARVAGIAQKSERALYKNLETLEQRKLIFYDHKMLALTSKGHKEYQKILATLDPYFGASKLLAQGLHSKKAKTVLTT
jgi:hypothetical protein